jgi:hypothetical protein
MIKNLELISIEGKRFGGTKAKKVRVDLSGSITNVERDGEDALVSFRFTTNYGTLGRIDIEGKIGYGGENSDKLIDSWRENQKLEDDVARQLYGAMMGVCVSEAVLIARDLRLPPPIPLPPLPGAKFGPEKKDKKGGPEFG